jgi:septal ring factor EnvC (AmiA/AmiB activator)
MPATTASIRVGNLADLRALQIERERLLARLVRASQRERAYLRLILCQEQSGRVMPIRNADLPEAA